MTDWIYTWLACLLSFGAGWAYARSAALREIAEIRTTYARKLDAYSANYQAFIKRDLERAAHALASSDERPKP